MQVAVFVKEALDEAPLYANLDHRPDVTELFMQKSLQPFESTLDSSFLNIFNQVGTANPIHSANPTWKKP